MSHVQDSAGPAVHFTDRDDYMAAFKQALSGLSPEDKRVLALHGTGGIGKSALIQEMKSRLRRDHPQRVVEEPRQEGGMDVVQVRVDFRDADSRNPADALFRTRSELRRGKGIPFHTFDIAHAHYRSLQSPHLPLADVSQKYLEGGGIATDIISTILDAPGVDLVGKLMLTGHKLKNTVRRWWTLRGEEELKRIVGVDEPADVLRLLPVFWAADLNAWRREFPACRVVVFLDSLDALREDPYRRAHDGAPDGWVRDWTRAMNGVLVVAAGRRRLDWTDEEPSWQGRIEHHTVRELAHGDAESYLRAAGISEPEIRRTIAERSEGMPLYLFWAVKAYRSVQAAEGRPPHLDEFNGGFVKLLKKSLDLLPATEEAALFALSAPETFDFETFAELMTALPTGVPPTAGALERLFQERFISEVGPGRYAVHSVVREGLAALDRSGIIAKAHRHLFERAQAVIDAADAGSITERERQALREGFTHGAAILNPEEFIAWYHRADDAFGAAGQWRLLAPLQDRVVEESRRIYGAADVRTAEAVRMLANLYTRQARFAAAEPLYRESLAIFEAKLGPRHLEVAGTLNNLARCCQAQGRPDEARRLYERSLGIFEEGPRRTALAGALRNLGTLYHGQGLLARAQDLYERSLAIFQERLPEGRDVAQLLNDLAGLHRLRGRHEESELLYGRALRIREKINRSHPDVAESLNDRGVLFFALGRLAEAEREYLESLRIREEQLGPEHPDVAGSLSNLAQVYREQGRYPEAEKLYHRAHSILAAHFGEPLHPAVSATLNNLAEVVRAQGRALAEPLRGQLERTSRARAEGAREVTPPEPS
jgi:tetratricopeptide (TPR) repeat protein